MYWRTSCLLAYLLTLLRFTSLTLASQNDVLPIGISLGVDEITSTYITENGDYVTVASLQPTQSWRDFAIFLHETNWDPIKSKKCTKFDVKQLLITEFSSILSATKAKLNVEIEITGITSPSFISEYGYSQLLIDTASQFQPSLKGGAFAWPYLHSIRLAHGLNNAESLGYAIGTNPNLDDCHLLHFDYQNRVLKASITEIGTDTTYEISRFRIHDFGGEAQNASPEKLKLLSTRTKALVKSVLEGQPPNYDPVQLSDFRGIIFSGDAPAAEFRKIRESIVGIFPEFADRFVEGIEPRWVAAVGAARLARLFKFQPERFQMEPGYVLVDSHDEL